VAREHKWVLKEVSKVVAELDHLIHEVGNGVMSYWLALILPSIVGESFEKEYQRGAGQRTIPWILSIHLAEMLTSG
jgi:hypothetical protein